MKNQSIAAIVVTALLGLPAKATEVEPVKTGKQTRNSNEAIGVPGQGARFRVWTDIGGRKARAVLVAYLANEHSVKLKGLDGTIHAVPLAVLSKDDRRFLATYEQRRFDRSALHLVSFLQQNEPSRKAGTAVQEAKDVMKGMIRAAPSDATRARFESRSSDLLRRVEAMRQENERVTEVIEKRVPVDVVKYCWVRCGLFGRRLVLRRIVVREIRTVTEARVSERGLSWDDDLVGKTDLNDTTFDFKDLPPTTGARLDFIRGLVRQHALVEIQDEIPTAEDLAVALITKWQARADGINERQYYYLGSIVSPLADSIAFEVRIKERPIGFNTPEDYVSVSDDDATQEFTRLASAMGLPEKSTD